jgi:hypothetical protein
MECVPVHTGSVVLTVPTPSAPTIAANVGSAASLIKKSMARPMPLVPARLGLKVRIAQFANVPTIATIPKRKNGEYATMAYAYVNRSGQVTIVVWL